MKTAYLRKSDDKTRPLAITSKSGEVLKLVCSTARARRVARQMNVKLVDETKVSTGVHISVIASQIRKEGESWGDAMRRAAKL